MLGMVPRLPGHIWEIILGIGGPLALGPLVSANRYHIAAIRIQRGKRRFSQLRARPPWVSGKVVSIWRPIHSRWKRGYLLEWSFPGVLPMWVVRIDEGSSRCSQYIHVSESSIFLYK